MRSSSYLIYDTQVRPFYTNTPNQKAPFLEVRKHTDIGFTRQAMLVQLGPKECVVASSDIAGDSNKLRLVLERNSVMVTERKKSWLFSIVCLI